MLNVTNDLTTTDFSSLPVLDDRQRRSFRNKFGYVGGSWCCAPVDEMKAGGTPRSAHFSLMRA